MTSQNIYKNSFVDVSVQTVFRRRDRQLTVNGFYGGLQQGEPVWKIRFAPVEEEQWQFRTVSNRVGSDGQTDEFDCVRPISGLTVSPRFPN